MQHDGEKILRETQYSHTYTPFETSIAYERYYISNSNLFNLCETKWEKWESNIEVCPVGIVTGEISWQGYLSAHIVPLLPSIPSSMLTQASGSVMDDHTAGNAFK